MMAFIRSYRGREKERLEMKALPHKGSALHIQLRTPLPQLLKLVVCLDFPQISSPSGGGPKRVSAETRERERTRAKDDGRRKRETYVLSPLYTVAYVPSPSFSSLWYASIFPYLFSLESCPPTFCGRDMRRGFLRDSASRKRPGWCGSESLCMGRTGSCDIVSRLCVGMPKLCTH